MKAIEKERRKHPRDLMFRVKAGFELLLVPTFPHEGHGPCPDSILVKGVPPEFQDFPEKIIDLVKKNARLPPTPGEGWIVHWSEIA
jgi:hypothetical protein